MTPHPTSTERRPTGFRPKHLLPNGITTISVVLGFLSILASAAGQYHRAVLMLFAAGVCDLLDGRLARLLDAGSAFGGELDSLADAVAFGVAPAVLAWFAFLRPLGAVGIGVAIIYLLAGIGRLARFNLDHSKRSTFFGAPIPVGAGYVLTFVLLRDVAPVAWLAVGMLLAAGLMISTLKVPNFKDRERSLPLVMLPVPLVAFSVFLARPSTVTWHVFNTINFALVGLNYRMLARRPELKVVVKDKAA